jgi:hypothetical protein
MAYALTKLFRSRARLEAEILALRQQINVLRRKSTCQFALNRGCCPECGWNLRGESPGTLRISDQAAGLSVLDRAVSPKPTQTIAWHLLEKN